jgi:hypothetical protein
MVLQDSDEEFFIKCPKCEHKAEKLYKPKDFVDVDDIKVLFDMKRTYRCSDKENCAYVFQLSRKDILSAFVKKVKTKDKEKKQKILNDIENIVEETREDKFNKFIEDKEGVS